jgi:hypothetical protein
MAMAARSLAAVAALTLAVLLPTDSFAGGHRAHGYRSPDYTVYGWNSNGSNFTYRRQGNLGFYNNSNGSFGTRIYSGQYRFDNYYSPRYGSGFRTIYRAPIGF